MRATLLQAPKVYKVNHFSQDQGSVTDHKMIRRYHNFLIQFKMTKIDLAGSTAGLCYVVYIVVLPVCRDPLMSTSKFN